MLNVIAAELRTNTVEEFSQVRPQSEFIRKHKRSSGFQSTYLQQIIVLQLYSLLLSSMIFVDLMISGSAIKTCIIEKNYIEILSKAILALMLSLITVLFALAERSESSCSKIWAVSLIIASFLVMAEIVRKLSNHKTFNNTINKVSEQIENLVRKNFISSQESIVTTMVVLIVFIHLLVFMHCLSRYSNSSQVL
jgi:hypothetical protein